MLWLKRQVGQVTLVDGERLVLVAKNAGYVTINFVGHEHTICINGSLKFPKFTLHVASTGKGLRYGFETDVNIVREEIL